MKYRNNLILWLAVTLVLSSIHRVVNPRADGNLFPFVSYPQNLEWYTYSLEQAVLKVLLFGLIWWLVSFVRKLVKAGLTVKDRMLQEAAEAVGSDTMYWIALFFFMWECKEPIEYVLVANQTSSLYDYLILGGLVLFTLIRSRKSG